MTVESGRAGLPDASPARYDASGARKMPDVRADDPGTATEAPETRRPLWRRWPLAAPAAALAVILAFAVHAEVRSRRRAEAIRSLGQIGQVTIVEGPPAGRTWRRLWLGGAPEPRVLSIQLEGGAATDGALDLAARIDGIEFLEARGDGVTDVGLARIAGLDCLRRLKLDRTSVTDPGLAHLYGLKNLEEIDLTGTRVTAGGVVELSERLPNARVVRDGGPPRGNRDGSSRDG